MLNKIWKFDEIDFDSISEFEKPLSKPKSNPLFNDEGLGYLKNIPIDIDTFSIEVLENFDG